MATVVNARDVIIMAESPRWSNDASAAMVISTSTPAFHVSSGGSGSPSSISITANLVMIPGTVTWAVLSGASGVTPSGNTCTLAYSAMTAASATVQASITYNTVTYTQTVVIAKVTDGSPGTAGTPGSPGSPGAPGPQNITTTAFAWSNSGVPSHSQAFTYTWSSGNVSAYPSGWTASAPSAPGTGYVLYTISLPITDSTGVAATTSANWSGALSGSIGYRNDGAPGSTGSIGPQGDSARIAYSKVSSGSAPSGTTTSTGTSSLPANPSFGLTWAASWATSPPSLSVNESLFQADGTYVIGTNTVTWSTPYLSNLKVGSLSAISAELGTVGISATGNLHSGTHGYADGTAGFFLGYSGTAYQFEVAASSSSYMRYSSSAGTLTFAGDINTAGTVVVTGSSSSGGGYNGAIVGNASSGIGVIGITAASSSVGVMGVTGTTGAGVYGYSASSGVGVQAASNTGWGVYASSAANAIGGSTIGTGGYAGVYGTCSASSSYGVYSNGRLETNSTLRSTGAWASPPSTGAGCEISQAGGWSYISSYDRAASAYIPLKIAGLGVQICGYGGTAGITVDSSNNVSISGNLSVSGSYPGGGGGVSSVNGNTGAVTAAQISAAATTGYGFTPYSNANPSGYITAGGSCAYASNAGAGWPTNLSSFTNGPGYITASGSCNYATSAGSGWPTNLSSFTNGPGYITSSGSCATATNQSGGTVNATTGAFSGVVGYTNSLYVTGGSGETHGAAAEMRGNGSAGYFNACSRSGGSASWVDAYLQGNNINFVCGGTAKGYFYASGTYAFQVQGSALASGGTWTNSDARLKHSIAPLDTGLDAILALRPVTFMWNQDGSEEYSEDQQVGFIAQDIEAAFAAKSYMRAIVKVGPDGSTKAMSKERLIPLLVKAVQELSDEVDKLKGKK